MSKTVIKRDGRKQELDVKKIRNIIEWACKGLSVNRILLESSLTTSLKDGVKTTEIQKNLIYQCVKKISANSTEWKLVAGRLLMSELHKNIRITRKKDLDNNYKGFLTHVLNFIKIGKYKTSLLERFTIEEIRVLGSHINFEKDFSYDYLCVNTMIERYLLPDELPQEMFMITAMILASKEEHHNRLPFALLVYDYLSSRVISLATPLLKNLRVPEGSGTSCFIVEVEDNIEHIFDSFKKIGLISKSGGASGVYLSRIRAIGSPVGKNENASGGIMPWCKIVNDIGIAVNQGGTRAGAITVAIDCWHLDTLSLLDSQTETGDHRAKTYDLFPQIIVSDLFMSRVLEDADWFMVDPHEVKTKLRIDLPTLWGDDFTEQWQIVESAIADGTLKLFKKIRAKELIKIIMKRLLETGLPYIAFKDTINRKNPNSHLGRIPCVNLCVESYSNVDSSHDHCCNLVSIVLPQIVDVTEAQFEKICATAVQILDNSIDITIPPTKEASTHNNTYRTIGVGTMGLADWLAYKEYNYSNIEIIKNLYEDFSLYCTQASVDLAKKRGRYSAFEGSQWDKGLLMNNRTLEDVIDSAQEKNKSKWHKLHKDIQCYGIRNSQITAIAPNTSTSLIMNATPSYLPVFALEHTVACTIGTVSVVPPFVAEKKWFYQEYKYIHPDIIIDVTSAIQEWIDTGLSMELIFNLNKNAYGENTQLKAVDMYNSIIRAWEKECKTIYYARTQEIIIDEMCSSCSG